MLTKNDPGNYDNFILVRTVTVVPGTSVYARLAQLLFPLINQCWWRHGASSLLQRRRQRAPTQPVSGINRKVVIDAKSFLTVEMTLNVLDVVK